MAELSRRKLPEWIESKVPEGFAFYAVDPELYRVRCGLFSLPVTEEVAARSVFLPIFGALSDADQDRIIDAVIGIVSR